MLPTHSHSHAGKVDPVHTERRIVEDGHPIPVSNPADEGLLDHRQIDHLKNTIIRRSPEANKQTKKKRKVSEISGRRRRGKRDRASFLTAFRIVGHSVVIRKVLRQPQLVPAEGVEEIDSDEREVGAEIQETDRDRSDRSVDERALQVRGSVGECVCAQGGVAAAVPVAS